MKCPECGKEIEADAEECPYCARESSTRTVMDSIAEMDDDDEILSTIKKTWKSVAGDDEDIGQTIKETVEAIAVPSRINVKTHTVVPAGDGPAPGPPPDYELVEQIGEGGMSLIYGARQNSMDRIVAVKMVRGKLDQRKKDILLAEAVTLGDLDHPNIVPVIDLGQNKNGEPFYSMKKVLGTPWGDVIKTHSRQENLDVLLRVCDAVAFAHDKDVIHRDLKPDNVMLGDYGEVYLMDWGLAAAVSEDGKAQPLDEVTAAGGTPPYMAPEMACGALDMIGKRSDIYLLGAILFEIVTGKLAHLGSTTYQCIFKAIKNIITPVEERNELLDIAYTAMAFDPEDRFGTVQGFRDAVRDYQTHFESIRLSEQAEELLKEGGEDYTPYANAVFGYREALKIWQENYNAQTGLVSAKLQYAAAAFKKGDLDLASSLLDEDTPGHQNLKARVEQALKDRSANEERYQKVSQELDTAMEIQKQLLPNKIPQLTDFDIDVFSQSGGQIGGNYYDFIPLSRTKLAILVAQMTGTGIPAALDMAMVRTIFRLMSPGTRSPVQLLKRLNKVYSVDNLSSRQVAAIVIYMNIGRQKEIQLATAGDLDLLLYRSQFKKTDTFRTSSHTIGSVSEEQFNADITDKTIPWSRGDSFFLCTGGVFYVKNQKDETYTKARFRDLVTEAGQLPLANIFTTYTDSLEKFSEGGVQPADITLVGVKFKSENIIATVDDLNWKIHTGKWDVQRGKIIANGKTGKGFAKQDGYLYLDLVHPDDFEFSATMKAVGTQEIAVWFCGSPHQVERAGYSVTVKTDRCDIQRETTKVARGSTHIKAGYNHRLTVRRKGSLIEAFLDDEKEPFLSFDDSRPLKGRGHQTLGFYVWGNHVEISDWLVKELS